MINVNVPKVFFLKIWLSKNSGGFELCGSPNKYLRPLSNNDKQPSFRKK